MIHNLPERDDMDIILDVDCVVADFVGAVLAIVEKTDRSIADQWNWWDVHFTKEEADKIRYVLANSQEFWQNLPIIEGTIEGVQFLRDMKHNIIWCTAPYESKYGWESDRRIWLQKNDLLREGDKLVFTEHKEIVRAIAIIDDREEYLDPWEKNNKNGIAFLFESELNINSKLERLNWKTIMSKRFFQHAKYIEEYT